MQRPIRYDRAKRETRQWWWIWVADPQDGRIVVMGPHSTQQDATNEGCNKIGHLPFDVISLPTRERHLARDIIAAKRQGQAARLEDIIRKHNRSEATQKALDNE